jgi:ubiquinone/menaquinone biosynthesis C-methylase UbiE
MARNSEYKTPMAKRFFDYYVELMKTNRSDPCHILELGSGPGFLAQHLLSQLDHIEYTAFDFSEVMHQLAQEKLNSSEQSRVKYFVGNFKEPNWQNALDRKYDFIIIHQALHELRHKQYAANFHKIVRTLLNPDGIYLVCDHLCAPHAMQNNQLYMNKQEHLDAFSQASFQEIKMPLEIEGLCLFEMSLS